eukprot:scaffold1130_cov195-Pinguiococcus_pyrenoidosus.AAC.21
MGGIAGGVLARARKGAWSAGVPVSQLLNLGHEGFYVRILHADVSQEHGQVLQILQRPLPRCDPQTADCPSSRCTAPPAPPLFLLPAASPVPKPRFISFSPTSLLLSSGFSPLSFTCKGGWRFPYLHQGPRVAAFLAHVEVIQHLLGHLVGHQVAQAVGLRGRIRCCPEPQLLLRCLGPQSPSWAVLLAARRAQYQVGVRHARHRPPRPLRSAPMVVAPLCKAPLEARDGGHEGRAELRLRLPAKRAVAEEVQRPGDGEVACGHAASGPDASSGVPLAHREARNTKEAQDERGEHEGAGPRSAAPRIRQQNIGESLPSVTVLPGRP